MSNVPQGSAVPHVEPQNGARRPLGGGPTTPLGVQQSPPGMYAAPVPPVQTPAPSAQAGAPIAAIPPASPPPWAPKAEPALMPLDPTIEHHVLEGLRAEGVTVEQILQHFNGIVVYAQVEALAQKHGLPLRREQAMPQAAPPQAGAAPARTRDKITKDKHYPLIAQNYLAKGVRDVAQIALELNITEKATEKAIKAIEKEPAKWGLAAPAAPTSASAVAAPATPATPEQMAAQLAFEQWVPEIGQLIPGSRNVLPDKAVSLKIRAAGLDISWSSEHNAWLIGPQAPSSFVSRETTTEKPLGHPEHVEAMERSANAALANGLVGMTESAEPTSVFATEPPASIQRALAVLADVYELAKTKGYTFDELEAASGMLAAQ